MRIDGYAVSDLRFPTSREKHGSDAMNPDPDYSCAYVSLKVGQRIVGNGLTFTIGRGNELCVAAIEALIKPLIGRSLSEFADDLGLVNRLLQDDSQYRWLGPEKGVVHLATAAIVNSVWDALAKQAGLPLWKYVAGLAPERLVEAIDFRHITDFLTPDEALQILHRSEPHKERRVGELQRIGYPAYTTSIGWIGYPDDYVAAELKRLHRDGWRHFKLKVGRSLEEDVRRCALFRETLGDNVALSVDANQVWDVPEAISWIKELAPFDLTWVEEATSPDDIIGHRKISEAVAPTKLASGEHAHNRVMFKQLLEAQAIGYCQIDACRLAGVNENLAVMLMAHKASIPVCPHAGGIGLCEYVQHLSMIDYVCISGAMDDRWTEHAGQLHHHFVEPITIKNGRYMPPSRPGYSIDLVPSTVEDFAFPDGVAWRTARVA